MQADGKYLVFDWNCTLLDDVHALHSCTNKLLALAGRDPLTLEHFQDHYEIPFERFYQRMGFTESEAADMMRLENNTFHEHYEPLADQAGLREGAADILGHARQHGVDAMIVSNHVVGPIRNQLKRHGIEHLFSEVIAYADRATQFKHMTKGEKLRAFMIEKNIPAGGIIVGDTVEEIHIARDSGMVSVALTGGCASEARLRAEKPDHVIHSLHELKDILRERGFVK